MENIQLNDLMNIIEYEKVRQKYRNDLIVYKKRRRNWYWTKHYCYF